MAACLGGCKREPVPLGSYEWVDPAARKASFPLFPGATVLPEQTDLLRRARASLRPKAVATERLALFETEAPIDSVAAHFAALYAPADSAAAPVERGGGDLAEDEAALAPLLGKLSQRYTPGVGKGAYRSAQVAGGSGRPSISLQRPYRDFVRDRVVDRTLIMIVE